MNNEIVVVEPIEEKNLNKKKLNKIGNKNILISQIPNLVSSQQLSNAYRVIMPPNITGTLMQKKGTGGLLTTTMKGENGKIVGHAGLESTSNMVSPLLIFTAMSVVTGQYFLSQINQSLNDVLNEINNIKKLLLLKEESDLFAHSIFLKRIFNDYTNISTSKELKIATLSNIQETINKLSSKIYFYTHITINELDNISNNGYEQELSIKEIKNNLEKLKVSLDLRNMFILLEFSFSQSFDENSIENIKQNILADNIETFQPLIDKILDTTKSMKTNLASEAKTIDKQEKLKNFLNELSSLKIGINKKYFEKKQNLINNTLDKLKTIDKEGLEYYITDDGIYTYA